MAGSCEGKGGAGAGAGVTAVRGRGVRVSWDYLIDEGESASKILKKIKNVDGDVIIPAAMLRKLLHELQKRRKQMSKPQKKNKK